MANDDKKKKLKKIVTKDKVKIKFYGEEMIEKTIPADGRVYIPKSWIGAKVKIVRC